MEQTVQNDGDNIYQSERSVIVIRELLNLCLRYHQQQQQRQRKQKQRINIIENDAADDVESNKAFALLSRFFSSAEYKDNEINLAADFGPIGVVLQAYIEEMVELEIGQETKFEWFNNLDIKVGPIYNFLLAKPEMEPT